MDRQIQLVTISLDALLKAEIFDVIVLLDQLEKDAIELSCYSTEPLKHAKLKLKEAGLFKYFDILTTHIPVRGLFIQKPEDVNYPSVMFTIGQRRLRLPIAVVLNLHLVEPLTKDTNLDG